MYYGEHYFTKIKVDKTCPNCKLSFPTSMPMKQTYCTPNCREEAKHKRIDEVTASMSAERITYLTERFAAFEKDEFKCTVCGRSTKDGAVLDTVQDGTVLTTVCTDCKTGRGLQESIEYDEV